MSNSDKTNLNNDARSSQIAAPTGEQPPLHNWLQQSDSRHRWYGWIIFAVASISILATAGTVILPVTEVYRAMPSDQPLVFANQEGFVIKATVPATGTWQLGVDVSWDEYPAGSF